MSLAVLFWRNKPELAIFISKPEIADDLATYSRQASINHVGDMERDYGIITGLCCGRALLRPKHSMMAAWRRIVIELRDGGTYAAVNWVIIGSGNGLVPNRRQAIIWTNADLTPLEYSSAKMSVYCGSFWTSFNEWNSLFMLVVKYDLVLRTHLVATEMIIIWCFHLNILIFAPNEIFISTILPLSRWAILYGDTNTRARYFWITPGHDSEVRHVHMAEDWYILLTATVTQLTIIINLYFGLSARYHTPVGFVWASIH